MTKKMILIVLMLLSQLFLTSCFSSTTRSRAGAGTNAVVSFRALDLKKEHRKDEAFLIAINAGQDETVKSLLESDRGLATRKLSTIGHEALHQAAGADSVFLLGKNSNWNIYKNMIDLLVSSGANINAVDDAGKTPLFYVVSHFFFRLARPHGEISNGRSIIYRLDATKLLLGHGADVNAKDKLGNTVLHYAAVIGDSELVELLLGNGADVNARSNGGFTPLSLTTERKVYWGVRQALLAHGATE